MPIAEHGRRYGGDSHCTSTFTASRGSFPPEETIAEVTFEFLSPGTDNEGAIDTGSSCKFAISVRSPCKDGPVTANVDPCTNEGLYKTDQRYRKYDLAHTRCAAAFAVTQETESERLG
jgi:hypothetical protein